MNVAGKWDYSRVLEPVPYGDLATYEKAAAFLDHLGEAVEDWGSGTSYARRYFKKARYVSVDGSPSLWADVVTDLASYTSSSADGILLRHVLEHNSEWRKILGNAVKSFKKRLAIVFFIPPAAGPTRLLHHDEKGFPYYELSRVEIEAELKGLLVEEEEVKTWKPSPFKYERIFYVCRKEQTPSGRANSVDRS